jgi:hypothetical protein
MAADHEVFLQRLAGDVAAAYVDHTAAVAALVAGSTADGTCDEWSDIDLILFYRDWPGAPTFERTRSLLDPQTVHTLGGDLAGDVYLEQFNVQGVACQLVHQTVDAWRQTAATVLEELDVASPVQKALSGIHHGRILHGNDLINDLRAAAAYPPALRAAMVRANLDVFPLWMLQESLAKRDAELWQRGELINGLEKVLAILAGVNEVFFSTFQLKHMHELTASFSTAPTDLAQRIDAALVAPMPRAALELERLLDEALVIVERQLPEIDVTPVRGRIGRRHEPWSIPKAAD